VRGVDEMVISLVARGMSTGDVQAHLAEVYGSSVSRLKQEPQASNSRHAEHPLTDLDQLRLHGIASWAGRGRTTPPPGQITRRDQPTG
jgi:hypothetical protein